MLTGKEDKSGNITIKLTDFGLATTYQEGENLKESIGSLIYMAPELVKKQKYNEKIDIWGVGVIAHIVLCGCPPFDQGTDT